MSQTDARAKLEAQRAYFSSDDRIRECAEAWRDASPEERLAAVDDACADAEYFLGRLDPAALDRALRPEPLPADTLELLESLWSQRRR